MENKLYFGGIPTEPDVNRLIDAFSVDDLKPGTQISYNETARIINQKVRTYRWKTVTTSWRKKLENDYNIILVCIPESQAFEVLTEPGKVKLSRSKLRSSVRLARRSIDVSGRVNLKALSDEERKAHDFNCNKASAVIASGQLRSAQKQLPTLD